VPAFRVARQGLAVAAAVLAVVVLTALAPAPAAAHEAATTVRAHIEEDSVIHDPAEERRPSFNSSGRRSPAGSEPAGNGYHGEGEMNDYPVTFAVDYPDRELNRLTSFFRIFTVIPIAILFSTITGYTSSMEGVDGTTVTIAISGVGLLFIPVLLMILFRRKYPRWWFDWNLELQRFANRIGVYALLMEDRYPSTDEEQAVHLVYRYPDVQGDLGRGMPLVKWLLAIPHYVVLFFLDIGAFFAVIGAWFTILFTGRYPRGIFDYIEGVMRWHNRVVGYAFALVTDEYPPFRLRA